MSAIKTQRGSAVKKMDWSPYVERYENGEWRTGIFFDMIVDEIDSSQSPATTLLDIGCGFGFDNERPYQEQLANKCQVLLGIEPDPAVEVAPHFDHLYRTTLEDAPIPAGSVDLCWSVMVLEHVDQPDRFFAKIHEILRDGGVFWGFTVDSRHYFSLMSWALARLSLRDRYLRWLHSSGEHGYYEHYPVCYRANSPSAVRKHAPGFRSYDFINFHRVGQIGGVLPTWLRFPFLLVDRAMQAVGCPGPTLAIRLQK